MNTIKKIDKIAFHTLSNFLISLGITPSEDGLIVQDYGPHRLYSLQGETSHEGPKLDPDWVFEKLIRYINHSNHFGRMPRFEAHNVLGYGCPDANCGHMLFFISISHTA